MGKKGLFSWEELIGIKTDINKPNGDCLASPCRLAPFQPRLLLNYPENRRKEPRTPAFLAAFVSHLCQSVPKQEPGSGTPPSSCNVSCRDLASRLPPDPTRWHDAPQPSGRPRLRRRPWVLPLPPGLGPQEHKGDNLVQIGEERVSRLKFRFIFCGAAKGVSSSCTQRGYCSLCRMSWG